MTGPGEHQDWPSFRTSATTRLVPESAVAEAVSAERDRIRGLAVERGAIYPIWCVKCKTDHKTGLFADLLGDPQ